MRDSSADKAKALAAAFAGTLAEGAVAGEPLDVFLAGDDRAARGTVKQLVRDGGLRPVDVGPLGAGAPRSRRSKPCNSRLRPPS